jgi:hypothetical protein
VERVKPPKRASDSSGPETYKEVLTNIKIVIFKENYLEDKLTQVDQDHILKKLGSVFRGTPKGALPTDMGSPRHGGTEGNETADQLAKFGAFLLIGPEPACGISAGIAKMAVKDWSNTDHKKYWESLTGLKQAKGFLQGPSVRRTKELLKLNRNQLW